MKIAINTCYGGFGLSYLAVKEYAKLKNFEIYAFTHDSKKDIYIEYDDNKTDLFFYLFYSKKPLVNGKIDNGDWFSERDIPRTDPDLIKIIEKLGNLANGEHAQLEIVDIPDDVEYEIVEYDGIEHIAEKHRTWS
jgi:hypothetical protein